ncbi:MAG: lytic transglycosylase domain-containing protein [Alphaproteobacteria bacterium]
MTDNREWRAGGALLARLIVVALTALMGVQAAATAAEVNGSARSKTIRSDLSVLSSSDRKAYARIFAAQDIGDLSTADRWIEKVDDPILMGHVQFQRYMHPSAYRSRYKELAAWMARYADHPNASRIYTLALKRKPSAAATPKPPLSRHWRFGTRERTAFEIHNPARSDAQRREARSIERRVRSLLRRERPTQSLTLINEPETRAKLTGVEYDRLRSRIARSYFMEQMDEVALDVAQAVSRDNRDAVPMADWTAGLAAWRTGNFVLAAEHFEALARAKHLGDWERSAGGFWAARAFLRAREPQQVIPMLRIAAQTPLSFYGLLARRQLAQPVLAQWRVPPLDRESVARLRRDKGVERAMALAELGQVALAEQELSWAHGRLKPEDDRALIGLARALHLPHSQFKAALSSNERDLAWGLFPTPAYEPHGGYTVDRALVFAIMRKESKFLAAAKSHAGAHGLMQLMPTTAHYVSGDRRYLGSGRELLFDPARNLALGQQYTTRLMGMMEPEGNLLMALCAYNAGPGNLRRWERTVRFQDDPLLFVEAIPVPETRDYIERVMAAFWIYRASMGQGTPSLDALASGAWPIYVPLDGHKPPALLAAAPGM